jgi:hypothetical protein
MTDKQITDLVKSLIKPIEIELKTIRRTSKITGIVNSFASKPELTQKLTALIGNSPAALDTLAELSAALGNDPNLATTITNQISNKVDKIEGKGLSTHDFNTTLKTKVETAGFGEQGIQGIQGVKGDKGDTGIQGDSIIFDKGTVNLINSKKAIVIFDVPLDKKPRIFLSFADNSQAQNPYVNNITTTGFVINFQNTTTTVIDWTAIERE